MVKIKVNKTELMRWFKKGWAYTGLATIVGVISSRVGVNAFYTLLQENPGIAITSLITLGVLSIIWGVLVYPIISGFLIEFINKRVR